MKPAILAGLALAAIDIEPPRPNWHDIRKRWQKPKLTKAKQKKKDKRKAQRNARRIMRANQK